MAPVNAIVARQLELGAGTLAPTPFRTNTRNDGRAFQKDLEMTAEAYERRGIAILKKVDPPVAVIWPFNKITGRKEQRVIFKKNPWLDFAGVWTARNGRALLIEAKSTSEHRLPFNRHGGLTDEQWESVKAWRFAGAAVAVLWKFNGKVTLFTPETLLMAERAGAKSLEHDEGRPVLPGEGAILWDFLAVLEKAIWPAPEAVKTV